MKIGQGFTIITRRKGSKENVGKGLFAFIIIPLQFGLSDKNYNIFHLKVRYALHII